MATKMFQNCCPTVYNCCADNCCANYREYCNCKCPCYCNRNCGCTPCRNMKLPPLLPPIDQTARCQDTCSKRNTGCDKAKAKLCKKPTVDDTVCTCDLHALKSLLYDSCFKNESSEECLTPKKPYGAGCHCRPQRAAAGQTFNVRAKPLDTIKEQVFAEEEVTALQAKTLEDSCADYLTIIHDNLMETTKTVVSTCFKDFFQCTVEKIQGLSAQMIRTECLLSKMYLDLLDRIAQQNQKNLRQFKFLYELVADKRQSNENIAVNMQNSLPNLKERSAGGGSIGGAVGIKNVNNSRQINYTIPPSRLQAAFEVLASSKLSQGENNCAMNTQNSASTSAGTSASTNASASASTNVNGNGNGSSGACRCCCCGGSCMFPPKKQNKNIEPANKIRPSNNRNKYQNNQQSNQSNNSHKINNKTKIAHPKDDEKKLKFVKRLQNGSFTTESLTEQALAKETEPISDESCTKTQNYSNFLNDLRWRRSQAKINSKRPEITQITCSDSNLHNISLQMSLA